MVSSGFVSFMLWFRLMRRVSRSFAWLLGLLASLIPLGFQRFSESVPVSIGFSISQFRTVSPGFAKVSSGLSTFRLVSCDITQFHMVLACFLHRLTRSLLDQLFSSFENCVCWGSKELPLIPLEVVAITLLRVVVAFATLVVVVACGPLVDA